MNKILGQDKPYNNLLNDLKNDRITHCYLFYGQSGVGKKLAAKAFFKQINGHDINCDCSFCLQVEKEIHPDLMVVYPDGKFIKIGQARRVQNFLSLIPIESKIKMAIIDDAHDLKVEAANALLKTLEEPPKNSVLVLVTSISERILITIKSRCRQVRFNAISKDDIAHHLKNNLGFDEEKSKLTAVLSSGVFGKALEISGSKDFWNDREEMIKLALRLPTIESSDCLELAEKIVEDATRQAKAVEKEHDIKASEVVKNILSEKLSIIQSVFRDKMVCNETNDKSVVINSDWISDIEERLSKIDSFKLVGYIEKVENAKAMIRQNVNTLLLLQSLFLNIEH